MVALLVTLWLAFSFAFYLFERDSGDTSIRSFGDALYWSTAAFSTAGIADTPVTPMAKLIGGVWIVLGSLLFFGAIVATVTAYVNRPLQRPHKRIIDTIEYNLEQLEELDVDELDLLKETVDTLILHMERLKQVKPKQDR
jgi:voltage-gated potassium channel